ncbi:MAG: glycosyl hydrolase, partial [Bacteroidales bacterium]|nr:glycosyl hydrolase [Bacteroidales bacterium]
SVDGGESWTNMGLKESRQIGGITVDPRNSEVVFVAAEGSVWGPGGERGLYKTMDGGKTWRKTLDISEHTGVNNVIIDPVDPEVLYLTTEQRRRHVFTKIGGGPESAVYKSTDNGETWRKITKGLPGAHLGGMGIAISPADHNILYLIVEAADGESGFYRSVNRGESWQKMSDHHSSGQYYNEIYCDPVDVDKVYSVETVSHVTTDGGKTWTALGLSNRHVDDHALWIDPDDTRHLMIGGDGGIYESFDEGKNWIFKSNLPVTQFYRVQVDNEFPFYNVYGGTQDNNTLGGPSMNLCSAGVSNEDWKAILGGDGFWVQIDPKNPDIVYCEYQYGNMFRYDKKSGETLNIKPLPRKDEKTYKWNWNAPLIISPHSNTRIYAFANKVFRSDDRGESWQVISDDLTSQTDRNTWPVMDQYWSIDAVQKDVSTSLFGTGVSLAESPVQEDLLFAGTDDGIISITEDAGKTWTKVKNFPGIPEFTYVSDIMPSKHDASVVFASFNNHKRDDFKPYVLRSNDKGKTWTSVAGNLPQNGSVHTLEQDHVNENLLFAGTEFGVFFSLDGGGEWVQLKSGIPTIAVFDMTIQERENDLVLATFGRGFYILEDFTPLRILSENKDILDTGSHLFPVKDALMYLQTDGKYGQGATLFHAPNPEFGAVFTYFLKDTPKTLKQIRKEEEEILFKDKKPIPQPDFEQLRAEENEIEPYLVFTVYDENGNVVRKITKKPSKGINRVNWDLRYDNPYPVRMAKKEFDPVASARGGMLAVPGTYRVGLDIMIRDSIRPLAEPVTFNTKILNNSVLPRQDAIIAGEFNKKLAELTRVMRGAQQLSEDNLQKIQQMMQTTLQSSSGNMELLSELRKIQNELNDILYQFDGPEAQASWEEIPPIHMPLNERLSSIVYTSWGSMHGVTGTMQANYDILLEEFPPVLEKINTVHSDLSILEKEMEKLGIQWTPGRVPSFR